jgi:hypothetical protein
MTRAASKRVYSTLLRLIYLRCLLLCTDVNFFFCEAYMCTSLTLSAQEDLDCLGTYKYVSSDSPQYANPTYRHTDVDRGCYLYWLGGYGVWAGYARIGSNTPYWYWFPKNATFPSEFSSPQLIKYGKFGSGSSAVWVSTNFTIRCLTITMYSQRTSGWCSDSDNDHQITDKNDCLVGAKFAGLSVTTRWTSTGILTPFVTISEYDTRGCWRTSVNAETLNFNPSTTSATGFGDCRDNICVCRITCSSGKYQDERGQTSCKSCPIGKYQNEAGRTYCTLCSGGQYQDEVSQPTCKLCSKGFYHDELGAGNLVNCKACESGTYSIGGASSCALNSSTCPQGTYASGTSIVCDDCAIGQYSNEIGQTACNNDCGSGSYINADRSECLLCPSGKYSSGNGTSTCFGIYAEREQGWCKDTPGHSRITSVEHCKQALESLFLSSRPWLTEITVEERSDVSTVGCHDYMNEGYLNHFDSYLYHNIGQTYSAGGFDHFLRCENSHGCACDVQCQLGEYQDEPGQASCKICPAGFYQDKTKMSNCKACAAGQFSVAGGTSCYNATNCPAGTYWSGNVTLCKSCSIGKYSAGIGRIRDCELEQARCSSLTECALSSICPDKDFSGLVSTASATFCATDTCGTSDADTCCVAREKCSSLDVNVMSTTLTQFGRISKRYTRLCQGDTDSGVYTGSLIPAAASTSGTSKEICCEKACNIRLSNFGTNNDPGLMGKFEPASEDLIGNDGKTLLYHDGKPYYISSEYHWLDGTVQKPWYLYWRNSGYWYVGKTLGSTLYANKYWRASALMSSGPTSAYTWYGGKHVKSQITIACDLCSHTKGKRENDVDCSCGTSLCTATTGRVCEFGKCKKHVNCWFTGGSAENSDVCSCGTTVCTGSTGFYCYADGNRCSNAVIPVCTKTTAISSILNPGACYCGESYCTEESNGLYCQNNQCFGPQCSNVNGAIINSGGCGCGLAECNSKSGLFCHGEFETCTKFAQCTIKNGSAPNSGNCTCGIKDCSTSTGLFCYALGNQCSKSIIPVCEFSDGKTFNQFVMTCQCGNTTCTLSTGLFCQARGSKCGREMIPDCAITDGSSANFEACACGTVFCTKSTGLFCFASKIVKNVYISDYCTERTPVPDNIDNKLRELLILWETNDISNQIKYSVTPLRYLKSKKEVIQRYGRVEDWNTSYVTTFANLFNGDGELLNNFNADLSKWDTSKVDTMKNSEHFSFDHFSFE